MHARGRVDYLSCITQSVGTSLHASMHLMHDTGTAGPECQCTYHHDELRELYFELRTEVLDHMVPISPCAHARKCIYTSSSAYEKHGERALW